MSDKIKKIIIKIMNIKNLFIYIFAIISSLITFILFFIAKEIITEKNQAKIHP